MNKPTAVLLCPGRGSYGRDELGSIARSLATGPVADALTSSDNARSAQRRATIRELDAAEKFRPGSHLDGENAAELIYFASLAHIELLRERYRVIAVAGNSLGWYTALVASGALDPTSGWRLVSTMAALQKQVAGGQILTTTVGEDWLVDEGLARTTAEVIASIAARGHESFVANSIRLGGHEVLAGTDSGVKALLAELPRVTVGDREFPFQLAGHGPFHTVRCGSTTLQARQMLADLPVRAPDQHLIDGFGNVHSPWSADPQSLFHYTTREQVIETYDFSAAVRTAMREFQPDVLVCVGPGQSLRAPVGHCVLREGWRNLRTKDALFESGVIRVD
jgi:[acyl-carrier-protein] S-malonyltransferase